MVKEITDSIPITNEKQTKDRVWAALENVKDPEIPVLSVIDMGIITAIEISNQQTVRITMTPTFIGCPAIEVIKKSINDELMALGFKEIEINIDFETPWTSDRMNVVAKQKLEKFGLAPPPVMNGEFSEDQLNNVRCPYCNSTDTTLRSAFGSTLCRAIRFCSNCKQRFEQFKPV